MILSQLTTIFNNKNDKRSVMIVTTHYDIINHNGYDWWSYSMDSEFVQFRSLNANEFITKC